MDQLRALKYFIKVVETGNFTKAAAQFSVPPSSLSRRVADLEKSLGATLLIRSTRVVKLTEIGQQYYQQVSSILNQLEHSNETVRCYQGDVVGKLRISAMSDFGKSILLPLLDVFNRLYPGIVLNVHLSDEIASIERDDIDVAIRGGYAPNERIVAIALMDNKFVPAAAPKYLQAMGNPKHALEMPKHKGLYYRTPKGRTPWLAQIDGQWQDVSGIETAISNSGQWILQKAANGHGIVMLPRWALKPYLERGELIELTINPPLSITPKPDFGTYLLYQKQRYPVPKIKAVVDFLVSHIKGHY